ncbi:hypothetical protein ACHAQE_010942 [Botrytis cinerea]
MMRSKSQDTRKIPPRTAQTQAVPSNNREINQTSEVAFKRTIPGTNGVIANTTKRFHHGIWIEPSAKESDLDCSPTDQQWIFANSFSWGDSLVSQKVENKMFKLLPKTVAETEKTEVKEKISKAFVVNTKTMNLPEPDSTFETLESTDRRSWRTHTKVKTYNDKTLAREAVSSSSEHQSDSDTSENTTRQQIVSSKQAQMAMEDAVRSHVRSESRSLGMEHGDNKRRSRRAHPKVKTYNTKVLSGTAIHTPTKFIKDYTLGVEERRQSLPPGRRR